MRRAVVATALVVVAMLAAIAAAPASAAAVPACALVLEGPYEYQVALTPFMADSSPVVPAPPTPPRTRASAARLSSTQEGGATAAAREALGAQFTMSWLSNPLQGWAVGMAPGPLDLAQARAAILDRLAARYSPEDVAFLASKLHVDPQPYSEAELKAVQAAVVADLQAAGPGIAWGVGLGLCQLSDAIRVEVQLFQPATPENVARVRALLAPYGDRVAFAVSPHGPPMPALSALPSGGGPTPAPPGTQATVGVGRYVSMARADRCIRTTRINVAVRRERRASVALLTVRVNGRRRTVGGARLRQPITIALKQRRTSVVVAVKLRNGLRGERAVTLTRCG